MDSMGNDHLPDLTSPAAARIIYPSAPSKAKHRATTSVALSNSVRGEPSNFLKAMGGHWYQFATWNLYHWDAILWKFHVRLIDNDYVLLIYHEFHGLELWNYKWRYWILLILHQGQRHSLVRFSPASDLYSTGNLLGICLFETGKFHFGCNAGIILYLLMAGKMPFDNSIYKEESKRQNGQLLTQIPGKALKSPSDDTPVCIFRMHRILQIHAWKLIWHWNILQFLQEIHLQMVDFPASHVNFRGGEVPPCFFSPCATLMPHWQNPKVATFPNKTPRGDVSPPTIS